MKPGLIAVLVCLASPAIAAEDVMSTRYGNTTVAIDVHGAESRTWYNADHTFASTQGGVQLKGTWSLEGNTLCRHYDVAPPGAPNPYCFPADKLRRVGERWTVGEGERKMSLTLVEGR
jgi:hypothetical protein